MRLDLHSLDYRVWVELKGVVYSGGEIVDLSDFRHLILIARQNLSRKLVQKAVAELWDSVQCTLGFGGENTQSEFE